jgi:dTDP-4-amino-4,6-dideoxygalactose transaminase
MPIPFLDLGAQYAAIRPEADAAIRRVLESNAYVLGPAVESFERAFADYCGVKHCVGLNSGTAALALLLQAAGIGRGDEVITVANSFFASLEAIVEIGATPVLVDCDEETALMNPAALEAAITPRTKAIVPVHLYGQPADMDAINALAKPRGIKVFEDACQAHGATYKGKKAGSLGDGAAFSFYPGKNLGAYGEGGAVTTDDEALAESIRMLREHGSKKKYHHELMGWNERMDGIQGAVLGVKLPHLDAWNAARRAHAARYAEKLPPSARMFSQSPGTMSCWHLLVVRVADRDHVRNELEARGIGTNIHYPLPIHLQPACKELGWQEGDFPVSEKLAGEILSLPMYAELTTEQVDEVCAAVGEVMG